MPDVPSCILGTEQVQHWHMATHAAGQGGLRGAPKVQVLAQAAQNPPQGLFQGPDTPGPAALPHLPSGASPMRVPRCPNPMRPCRTDLLSETINYQVSHT